MTIAGTLEVVCFCLLHRLSGRATGSDTERWRRRCLCVSVDRGLNRAQFRVPEFLKATKVKRVSTRRHTWASSSIATRRWFRCQQQARGRMGLSTHVEICCHCKRNWELDVRDWGAFVQSVRLMAAVVRCVVVKPYSYCYVQGVKEKELLLEEALVAWR